MGAVGLIYSVVLIGQIIGAIVKICLSGRTVIQHIHQQPLAFVRLVFKCPVYILTDRIRFGIGDSPTVLVIYAYIKVAQGTVLCVDKELA